MLLLKPNNTPLHSYLAALLLLNISLKPSGVGRQMGKQRFLSFYSNYLGNLSLLGLFFLPNYLRQLPWEPQSASASGLVFFTKLFEVTVSREPGIHFFGYFLQPFERQVIQCENTKWRNCNVLYNGVELISLHCAEEPLMA